MSGTLIFRATKAVIVPTARIRPPESYVCFAISNADEDSTFPPVIGKGERQFFSLSPARDAARHLLK
jgi:hypothetical protein